MSFTRTGYRVAGWAVALALAWAVVSGWWGGALSEWMSNFTAQLAAASVMVLATQVIPWKAGFMSISTLKNATIAKIDRKPFAWLRMLVHLFVFWFFINQLMGLLASTAPPSRLEVFLIAFWTTWLIAYFIQLIRQPSI